MFGLGYSKGIAPKRRPQTKCYIVIFKSDSKERRKDIKRALQNYPKWACITKTAFAVQSDLSAKDIRDELVKLLNDPKDRLMVILSGRVAAWRNVVCQSEWLKEYL